MNIENMETIPPIYWMIVIGLVIGFFCFLLYELAMLIRESKRAVGDSRKVIVEAQKTIDTVNMLLVDVTDIVSTVKGTVSEVNAAIIAPVRKISSLLSVVSGFTEGLTSKRK